jgi:hypothetical protein
LWPTTLAKMIELGLYKHYKGNIYEVIGVAKNSETLQLMVVYKASYQPKGENLWVRPLTLFNAELIVNGKAMERFAKI